VRGSGAFLQINFFASQPAVYYGRESEIGASPDSSAASPSPVVRQIADFVALLGEDHLVPSPDALGQVVSSQPV
jgi:hypothetical protein